MPFQGCMSGLAVSAVVAVVLLVPSWHYVPSIHRPPEPTFKLPAISPDIQSNVLATSLALCDDIPAIDVILTASFIAVALTVYLCDWIQGKLMQRRINKLNACLSASVARLQECDGRQAQLESSLRAVQSATSEYNLLLYLLLRQHRLPVAAAAPTPALDKLEDFDVEDYI